MKAIDLIERADLRQKRATMLASAVFREIDEYLRDDIRRNDVFDKLMDIFTQQGVEVLTDYDRQTCGLPPRGPDGWTAEELIALEENRLAALLAPIRVGPGRA